MEERSQSVEANFTPPPSGFGGDITGDLAWIGLGGFPGSELGCDLTQDGVLDPLAVPYGESVAGKIALIQRGACFFETKMKLAEDYGAIAVVIFNNVGDEILAMAGAGNFPVTIPAVMVGQSVGEALAALREDGVDTNITLTEAQCLNSIP